MARVRLLLWLLAALALFGAGCRQSNNPATTQTPGQQPSAGKDQAGPNAVRPEIGFATRRKFLDHYEKHGAEFGSIRGRSPAREASWSSPASCQPLPALLRALRPARDKPPSGGAARAAAGPSQSRHQRRRRHQHGGVQPGPGPARRLIAPCRPYYVRYNMLLRQWRRAAWRQ